MRRQAHDPSTLDELVQQLVDLEMAGHAVQFSKGDLLVAWLGHHVPARGEGRAFWGAVASGLRHSVSYVRDLYRVAKIFPNELRAQYPECDWSWWKELTRFPDPVDACGRCAELSVREVRDLRRAQTIGISEPTGRRIVLTLLGSHLDALMSLGRVAVGGVIPGDPPITVTATLEIRG